HVGYALGAVPARIPTSINTGIDDYTSREPAHSGRYGQSKDSYGGTGRLLTALFTGDRQLYLESLQASLLAGDITGVHSTLYLPQYAGGDRDGVHRRNRDLWSGHANDSQYFYPEYQFTAYWLGGVHRQRDRAVAITDALVRRKGSGPYPHGPWGWAYRYMWSHDETDKTQIGRAHV